MSDVPRITSSELRDLARTLYCECAQQPCEYTIRRAVERAEKALVRAAMAAAVLHRVITS